VVAPSESGPGEDPHVSDTRDAFESLERLAKAVIDRANALKRQRDFIEQVHERAALDPPNYSVLRRLLSLPAMDEVVEDFKPESESLIALKEATDEAWGRMRLSAINDFVKGAEQAGLAVRGQAPRFTVGRGNEVTFDVSKNRTSVNKTVIKSIDPRDVLEKVRADEERLWGENIDAAAEMERVYNAAKDEAASGGGAEGVSILRVYDRIIRGLPSPEKKKFSKEVFAARLSRLLESGTTTEDGHVLVLRPTASPSDALPIYLPDQADWAYRGRITFKEA
jgi:hypothetical protein